MKKNRIVVSLCALIILAVACDDIVEKNIAKEKVSLRSPSEDYVDTLGLGQTFWWDALEGATKYNLLIVSPNYQSANSKLLDSVISRTQFNTELPKGEYDWCVKAINGGYETDYTCRHISVNKDFSGQKDISLSDIKLLSPANNDTLSTTEVQTLKWNKLDGATNYELLVAYWDTANEETVIVLDSVTTSNEVVVDLAKRRYDWCVKGINSKYRTEYKCRSVLVYNKP